MTRKTAPPLTRHAFRPVVAVIAAGTAAVLCLGAPAMASAAETGMQVPTSALQKIPNTAPVAHDDTFSVVSGHPLAITWSSVLKNDADADGDTFAPAKAKEPLNGVIDYAGLVATKTITYTSTPGFVGTEKLAYWVKDSKGAVSTPGYITITVTPNHAPLGVKDTYTVQSGTLAIMKAPGVRANDTDADGDIAGSKVVITAPALHGTVATSTNSGGFTYISTPGFIGVDIFYYRVSDGFGGQSAVTPVILNVTVANFSEAPAPVITGTARVGETLSTWIGTWLPAPTTFTFQWKRNGVKIPGATASDYTLSATDVGQVITVSGIGSTANIPAFITDSLPTAKVLPGSLGWSTLKFDGNQLIGNTLTSTVGAWTPGPVTLSRQWMRDGVAVPGATGTTYLLTNADWGTSIRLDVTGSRAGYLTATHGTSATSPIRRGFSTAPEPVITGTLKVGKTVTASTSGWAPTPTSFTYEWRRDNFPIAGATGKTYTITKADADHALSVYVKPAKAGYYSPAIDCDAVYPTV